MYREFFSFQDLILTITWLNNTSSVFNNIMTTDPGWTETFILEQNLKCFTFSGLPGINFLSIFGKNKAPLTVYFHMKNQAYCKPCLHKFSMAMGKMTEIDITAVTKYSYISKDDKECHDPDTFDAATVENIKDYIWKGLEANNMTKCMIPFTTGLQDNEEICWEKDLSKFAMEIYFKYTRSKEGTSLRPCKMLSFTDQLRSQTYSPWIQSLDILYPSTYIYYEQKYSYGYTSFVAEMGGLVRLTLGFSFADAIGLFKWFQAKTKINKFTNK